MPPPSSSSSGSFDPPADYGPPTTMQYTLNSKIMVAAIIVLFVVVFFILGLHIYAKWFWRHSAMLSSRRSASWRRRHRLDFATGQDPLVGYRTFGLDKAVIDSLPTFVYQPPPKQGTVKAAGEQQEEVEGPMECAVCLSEFQENEKGRLLPACKHSFHTECIDMWFHSHSTCPLCRTIVSAPALPSPPPPEAGSNLPSPSMVEMQSHGPASALEQQHHQHHPDTPSSCPPSSIHHGSSVPYPSNVLFWGNHSRVLSQFSPPALASGSSSTRSLPHITIEIPPWRPEILASTPRSTSLSLSRLPSSDQACSSQPLKSPSIRASIKRLLSRERSGGRKVHPSSQEDSEHESDTTVEAV